MTVRHNLYVTEDQIGTVPVGTVSTSTIFLVDDDDAASAMPVNTPHLLTGPASIAALGLSEDSNMLKSLNAILAQTRARIVATRIAAAADDAAISGTPVNQLGVWSALRAKAELGVKPKIIIAPGRSSSATVAAAMVAVADRLWGIAIVDGPNDDDDGAVTFAAGLTDAKGRLYVVDPETLTEEAGPSQPASPFAAGIVAKVDAKHGFWVSPSNQPINGIVGTARPISFDLGFDDTSQATLTAAGVATIIRQGGWRLWGVRSVHGAQDETSLTGQLNQRRTVDTISESIQVALLWALAKGITRKFGEAIVSQVEEYCRRLKRFGAIAGFRVWLDPELNTPASLAAGGVYVDFAVTPTPAAEEITVRVHVTSEYLAEVLGAAA